MATRVNVKFVLILGGIVLGGAAILGGLWVLQYRGDTTRLIREGDEYMALGDYERAMKAYGRAVRKEPADLSHLRKVEQALLKVRPTTRDQASELDNMRLALLRHEVRYKPRDPEAHLKLLRELHRIARWLNQDSHWQDVGRAGQEMWDRLSPEEPMRAYGRLYRGLGKMHTTSLTVAGENEINEAEQDLAAFVEAFPENDLGWASLAEARLSFARQLRNAGQARRADAMFEQVDETMAEAAAAVPDGPEVARVLALHMIFRRFIEEEEIPDEELMVTVDRMVELAAPTADPMLLGEVGAILRMVDRRHGRDRAVELIQTYVDENPEAHYQRFLLASLHFLNADYEQARAECEVVIDAEPVTVSFLSRIQPILRKRAAALIFDIEHRLWDLAPKDQKAAAIERIEAAYARLANLVAVPETDPLMLRAEGKLASARGDYVTAAAKLERVLKLGSEDFETLWYAAQALEQLGQNGLALQRITAAMALQPGNPTVIAETARLEYRVGRYDEAEKLIEAALKIAPDHMLANRLKTAIAAEAGTESGDTVATALLAAEDAAREDDLETARTMLVNELETTKDQLPVLIALVEIQLRAGETESAREYLARALALQPTNESLRRLEASLGHEDQIEALIQYMARRYTDEAERAIQTFIHLRALAREMNRSARQLEEAGDTETAAQRRERAQVARAESERFLKTVQELAPNHPMLLEHLFIEAVRDEDWAALDSLVDRAKAADADQAGGLVFKGRVEMAREQYAQAVETLTEATVRKHYSALAWRLLGRAHEKLGNFSEALRSYEEAYGCNPNDQYAVRWYVNLLLQMGEQTRALRVLRQTRSTVLSDPLLQEAALQLEAEIGDVSVAMDQRRKIYDRHPDNRVNAIRLAALLGSTRPTFEHVVDKDGKPIYDGERWKMLSEKERQDKAGAVAAEWIKESNEIFAALEQEDDTLDLAVARAATLKARGQVDAGEKLLSDFAKSRPEPAANLAIALAGYQSSINRIQAAIDTLEAATPYQDPEQREVDRALAELYFSRKIWDPALERYLSLAEGSDERALLLRLAECHTKVFQFDEAEQVLNRAIDAGGHDFFTTLLAAAIARGQGNNLYNEGKVAEAAEKYAVEDRMLDRAEQLNPSSHLPHVRRAQGLLVEYFRTRNAVYLDDALRHLVKADRASSGAEATSVVRVEILRAKGDLRGAIGELTRLLGRYPDHVSARRLLAQLYVESGNIENAAQVIQAAIERNPTMAIWYEALGDLYVRRRMLDQASDAFLEACRLEPNASRVAKHAEISLRVEEPDFNEIVTVIESSKEPLDGNPFLRVLYGRALFGQGRRDQAWDQMRAAWGEHRDLIAQGLVNEEGLVEWYRAVQRMAGSPFEYEDFVRSFFDGAPDALATHWMSRTWVTVDAAHAIGLEYKALERCPQDKPALREEIALDLGQFEAMVQNYPAAAAAFEQVLELNPDNSLALNNVAYLYLEFLNEPERAIPYAQRAVELQPNNPNILDTLGWADFKSGRFEEAETALRKSINLGASAENHLHLAYVLESVATSHMDSGDRKAAQKKLHDAEVYLRRAAELRPSDETMNEINRLAGQVADKMKRLSQAPAPAGGPAVPA